MSQASYKKVREVMSGQPTTIDGLASVAEAVEMMREHGVSSLVIDRRHQGDEYGLIVVQDIASKVIGADRAPDRTSVYEIMAKPLLSLDADMDIKYAVRLLSRFGLSRAPVIEDGKLTGIVTLRDMVFRFLGVAEDAQGD